MKTEIKKKYSAPEFEVVEFTLKSDIMALDDDVFSSRVESVMYDGGTDLGEW